MNLKKTDLALKQVQILFPSQLNQNLDHRQSEVKKLKYNLQNLWE